MSVFTAFKDMAEEETDSNFVTFRTSRVGFVLGILFVIAGLGIITQVAGSKFFASYMGFCVFSLAVAGLFIIAGLVLATYSKKVSVDRLNSKISLFESSIVGLRSTNFHFKDIMTIEVSKDTQCFLSDSANLWIVKIFVNSGNDDFTVERIFSSASAREAKNAAETLAFQLGIKPVFSCQPSEKLFLNHI